MPDNTRVIADPADSKRLYAMDLFKGELYVSTDGGADFNEQLLNLPGGLPNREMYRGDDCGGQDRIYPTPSMGIDTLRRGRPQDLRPGIPRYTRSRNIIR